MNNKFYVETLDELSSKLRKKFGRVETILDIGCGIRPFAWVRSNSIVCVEPFDVYRKSLISSFGLERLVAIKANLESVTSIIDPSQFSLVTLIDVIEHLSKESGENALRSLIEKGARNILVFTPNGFMPQHAHGPDAWGFLSGSQQEHLSGWDVSDFLSLGFNEFWYVKNLHILDGKTWDGLLAIYSKKEIFKSKFYFWDPQEELNEDPVSCETLIVFGRHNRYSGTVLGVSKNISYRRKIYLPSLSFLPKPLNSSYKTFLQMLIKFLA